MLKIKCSECNKFKKLDELFDYDKLVQIALCKECCHSEDKSAEEQINWYNISLKNYRDTLKKFSYLPDKNDVKKAREYIYSRIREIEEKINKLENKCDGCETIRMTNKIVDGEGKKYHSYTCAERESKSMLCCLNCHKMIPVSRYVYELAKCGTIPGISCSDKECEKKTIKKLKKETGKEYGGIIDVDENDQLHFRK